MARFQRSAATEAAASCVASELALLEVVVALLALQAIGISRLAGVDHRHWASTSRLQMTC